MRHGSGAIRSLGLVLVMFKIGLYRDTLPVPMTILLARFRRGTSHAEVDPSAAP